MESFLLIIIDVIIKAGVGQGFFLGIVLLTNKNKKSTSNLFLAILLIVLSVSILHSILASSIFESPYKIREPFILFIGPLLLFYVCELTGLKQITWKDTIHFVPFGLLIMFLLPAWSSGTSSYASFLNENGVLIGKILWALIVFQFGYYWFYIISVLQKNRLIVETEFSNLEGKTLSWLHYFLHVLGGFLLLLVLTVVIAFHTSYYHLIDIIVCFGLSLSIFALGHNGLFQEEVFSTKTAFNEINQFEKTQQTSSQKKLAPAVIKNEELLEKLKTHIEETKPYLDESLTLTELAKQVGMTRNQLSALINNTTGENFYTFINKYRIEEVKMLITDPTKKNFTILSLAYEAGFSSKSAFQDIFKRLTGLTPTQYRNRQ